MNTLLPPDPMPSTLGGRPAAVGAPLAPAASRLAAPRSLGKRAEVARLRNRLQKEPNLDPRVRRELLLELSSRVEPWDVAQALSAAREACVLLVPGDDRGRRRAWERLGELSERIGAHAEAAEAASRAAELAQEAEAVPLLLRAAVLTARGGRFGETERLLLQARALGGSDVHTFELLGELSGAVSSEGLSPGGASAYLAAADLARAQGEVERELLALRRAHALDPRSPEVVERYAGVLHASGLLELADELWRSLPSGPAIVTRRLAGARGRPELGLQIALEVGLDLAERPAAREVREHTGDAGEVAKDFLGVLAAAGFWDVLALYHEACSASVAPAARALHLVHAAQAWAGPLANPERALWLVGEALRVDPARGEALDLLVGWAGVDAEACLHVLLGVCTAAVAESTGRGGAHESADGALSEAHRGRVRCVRELHAMAQRAGRRTLAGWALARLATLTELAPEEAQELAMVAPDIELERAAVHESLRALDGTPEPSERLALLEAAVEALLDLPDLVDTHARALDALIALDADNERLLVTAAGLAWRRGDLVARAEHLRRLRGDTHPETFLAELAVRRRGAGKVVDEHLRRGLAAGGQLTAAVAWVESALRGDRSLRAEALVAYAEHLDVPALRSVLWTQAAADELESQPGLALSLIRAARAQSRSCAPLRLALLAETDAEAVRAAQRELFGRLPTPELGLQLVAAMLTAQESSAWEGAASSADAALDITPILVQALRLRPSHGATLMSGFRLACDSGNPRAIGAVLEAALTGLLPVDALADTVAGALLALAARDRQAAREQGLRVLAVMGPMAPKLRHALLAIADESQQHVLATQVLTQWLGSDALTVGAAVTVRRDIVLALAERRALAGDLDGEAFAVAEAVHLGGEAGGVLLWLEQMVRNRERLSGDAEYALLGASVAIAEQRNEPARSARALRALAVATWDLLEDKDATLALARRGVELAPELAPKALGLDLCMLFGAAETSRLLLVLAESFADPAARGALLAEAAKASLVAGDQKAAFALAVAALRDNPARTFALELAERTSAWAESLEEMSELYERVAQSAKGRFGRRAAYYRGARFFEARGAWELTLHHMAMAFRAVPSDGASLLALTRVAARATDASPAVRVLEEIAQEAPRGSQRAAWLLRAAQLHEGHVQGAAARFDLVLRALALDPSAEVAHALGPAADALAQEGEDAEALVRMRLERAIGRATSKLDGPNDARLALGLLPPALRWVGAEAAFGLVAAALLAAGDLEELTAVVPRAADLVAWEEPADAVAALESLGEALARPYVNLGRSGARVFDGATQALAARLTDQPELGRRLQPLAWLARVLLAERPDDDAQVDRDALRALAEQLAEAAPPLRDRVAKLVATAERQHGPARSSTAAARADAVDGLSSWPAPPSTAPIAAGRIVELAEAPAPAQVSEADDWSDLVGDAPLPAREPVAIEAPRRPSVRPEPAHAIVAASPPPAAPTTSASGTPLGLGSVDPRVTSAALPEIVDESDRAALAEHLSERAAALLASEGLSDAQRAVRLRRIALLEQYLDRPNDAVDELRELVRDFPRSQGPRRYLADLAERLSLFDESLGQWQALRDEAAAAGNDTHELDLNVLRLLERTGNAQKAYTMLSTFVRSAEASPQLLAIKIDALRQLGRTAELGDSLEAYADALPEGDPARVTSLLQAAQCAARTQKMYLALQRAERAVKEQPGLGEAVLLAAALAYQIRGAGTPEEARTTVLELTQLEGRLGREDASLRAFLLAEALDVVEGHGAGQRELSLAEEEIGSTPLLSLGLAERQAKRFQFQAALDFFEHALSGELYGMRRAGQVALAAADAAFRLHELTRGWDLLERAYQDPEARHHALQRMLQVGMQTGDSVRAMRAVRALVEIAPADERPLRRHELGRRLQACDNESLKGHGAQLLAQVMDEMNPGAPYGSVPPPAGGASTRVRSVPHDLDRVAAMRGEGPSPAQTNDARARLEQGDMTALAVLEEAALNGSPNAADALAAHYEAHSRADQPRPSAPPPAPGSIPPPPASMLPPRNKSQDPAVLRFRTLAAALTPLDGKRLELLRRAALGDHNPTYARALDHVARAFDPAAGPLPPPPLLVQTEQPGFTSLLAAGNDPLLRAMAELHASAGTPILYALHGKEPRTPRHPHHGLPTGSTVAALFEVCMRLLTAPYAQVSVMGDAGDPLGFEFELHETPHVWLRGPLLEDTLELRYCVGFALASIFPESALLLGLAEHEARVVFHAVVRAFGPSAAQKPEAGTLEPHDEKRVYELVEVLWQVVPGRVQRQVQNLLERESTLDFDDARRRARLAGLRFALFVTGDFGFTVQRYLQSLGYERSLSARTVQALLVERPELGELYRLALRPEYADARWQDPTSAQRTRLSSTSLRAV